MKIEYIGNLFIVMVICVALYAQFGGMAAHAGAARYVKQLEANGASCETIRQSSGPAHSRKTYWVCDGKEIKWWHGHFWEWWDK